MSRDWGVTRIKCQVDHEDPPYVVIDGLYCETCERDLPGRVGGPHFPLEVCAMCIRSGLTECSVCEGTALLWRQAVPA